MATRSLRRDRWAATHGVVGVVLNLVAVAFLRPVPHTYTPSLTEWLAETRAAPSATLWSAWAFTVGLVAMAAFAMGVARAVTPRSNGVRAGAWWFAIGACFDAAGTLAPVAALNVGDDAARALLNVSLLMDASFNGALGVGLILINLTAGASLPKWVRALGVVAGLVSLPVVLQFQSESAAKLLVLAAPLWVTWVCAVSVVLFRAPKETEHA